MSQSAISGIRENFLMTDCAIPSPFIPGTAMASTTSLVMGLALGRGTGIARRLRFPFAKPYIESPVPSPKLAGKINRQFGNDGALIEKFAQAGRTLAAQRCHANAVSNILLPPIPERAARSNLLRKIALQICSFPARRRGRRLHLLTGCRNIQKLTCPV